MEQTDELLAVMREQMKQYPLSEPRDAVKLVYQNEFGGGHLITDRAACRARLLAEYEATPQNTSLPLTESIGNGLVRVNLAAMNSAGYTPERLFDDFAASAESHRGTLPAFWEKLHFLTSRFEEVGFPFSRAEWEDYLAVYRAAGYPAVSHSDAYRNAYHPAYRVVALERLK